MLQMTVYVPQDAFPMALHAIKTSGGGRFGKDQWRLSYKLMFTMSSEIGKDRAEKTESQYEITFPCSNKFMKTVIRSLKMACGEDFYYFTTPVAGMSMVQGKDEIRGNLKKQMKQVKQKEQKNQKKQRKHEKEASVALQGC